MALDTLPTTMLDAALACAARGWRVFPLHEIRPQGTQCSCGKRDCGSPGKHPRTARGCLDASADPVVIRRWWNQNPTAGVGLATGNGLAVVDVDPRHNGDDTLRDLERALGALPVTVEVLTGGGGRHLYLSTPPGVPVRCSAGQLGEGLDLRGEGGYVVAPPTIHVSGRRYAWEASGDPADVEVAPMPAAWLERVLRRARPAAAAMLDQLQPIGEGSRNGTLFSLGRSLRAKGLSEGAIVAALQAENEARCSPPLDSREVEMLARSAASVAPGLSVEAAQLQKEAAARRERAVVATPSPAAPLPAEADEESSPEARTFARGDSVELGAAVLQDLEVGSASPVVHDRGAFWRYDDARGVFVELSRDAVYNAVSRYAGAATGSKGKPLSLGDTAIKGALHAAAHFAAKPGFFDKASRGVCFADCFGTVEAGAVKLLPHSPEHRAQHSLGVPYELPECQVWTSCLREVFRRVRDDGTLDHTDTDQCIALFQEFAGASLLGTATSYALCLLLVGPGNDGKSTVLAVLRALFPPTAVCSVPPQSWSRGFLAAELAGKRLNVVSELPEQDIMDSSRFKAIVSGDPTTAERKFSDPFTMVPEAGHVFATNDLPPTRDQSKGFWRRMGVLTCNRSFVAGEEVRDYARQVLDGGVGALASWALEGAARLQAQGSYTMPPSAEQARADWQHDSDQVRQWKTDCCLEGEESIDALYGAYRQWCMESGHQPLTRNKLGSRLKVLGLEHRTKHARLYRVALKPRWREAVQTWGKR